MNSMIHFASASIVVSTHSLIPKLVSFSKPKPYTLNCSLRLPKLRVSALNDQQHPPESQTRVVADDEGIKLPCPISLLVVTSGEDTRKSFTSHLYDALIQKKIETFIDNHIEKGDEISPALIKAIEDSRVSIVIFSEDYASSKWCLNELVKILQCKKDEGQTVMPVFYNIQPTHVRNQTGSYEKTFAQHERDLKLKHNQDKLQKWKAALTEATYIVGYEFPSDNYRNESDLIKDIVKDVLQKMKHIYPFEIKGLVGIKEKMEEIELLLQSGSSNDVRVIGLWGMGGVGKTTLAKALCGKLCHEFEAYCFLENAREELKRHGIIVVRHRLLSALLEEQNLRLDALYVENISIMRRLAYKKVFFVLDDVSSSKQIEDLFVNHNINSCLGPGSRVIVTTRDKHTCSEIYEVKGLNEKDSLELFCMNAFKEKHPKNGYEELSKCVVDYCKGNPLALKVMGANMNRFKNKEAWKSEVEKLKKIPNGEIMNILKLSLDDLDNTQMNIFLDIACFYFLRRSSTYEVTLYNPMDVLDACGFCAPSGIQVLLDKSLITTYFGFIEMHNLVQEMGQQMVDQESIKDPCIRSRLWKDEEVVHVLKNNKGTEKIEGIAFDSSKVGAVSLSSDSFKRMTNLRYLAIAGRTNVYFPDGLEWLSDKLRYLRWNQFPLESLPSTFCAELLVELYMPGSKLKKLWDGVQDLANLRTIDLDGSIDLIEMPDLSRATNLERLSLSRCENLCELCPSILSLPKLAYLYLQGCTKIQSLRSNIHSKSLQELDLSKCSSLTNFLVTSEKMIQMSLRGTAITELPSSFWHNTKLTRLDLSDCKQFSIVGKNFISNDDPIGQLVFVKKLNLSGCTQMDALNLGILLNSIQSLEILELSGCSNLEALPTNILKHSMLECLDLDDCRKLVFSLTDLPTSLLFLSAAHCSYLDINSKLLLSDRVRLLGFLKHLILCGCKEIDQSNLAVLLDGIQSLKELKLRGCCNLEALPENIQKHSMLELLLLDDCTKLVFTLTNLHMPSLLYLSAANCTYLDTNSIQPLLLENNMNSFDEDTNEFLFVPVGGQILCEFEFHTTDIASITIPPIPKSGLRAFIFRIILSQGLVFNYGPYIRCWIYENGKQIDGVVIFNGDENKYRGKIISDHVLCFLLDGIDEIGENEEDEENGHYNLSFEFKLPIAGNGDDEEWSTNGIKGCGVLCVYDDTLDHEFEMTDASRRSGVEIVELESTAQASNHESLVPRVIRNEVEVSTNANEYENEQEQHIPPNKRKRKMMT